MPTRMWWALGALVVIAAGVVGVLLSGGTSSDSATAHGTDDRHAALIARLPASVYADCVAAPAREVNGVVTAVDCSSVEPGAASVLVSDFGSASAMAADFQSRYVSRLPDGRCSSQAEVRSTWGQGRLACYANASKAAVLLYEYDARAIAVLALCGDGNATALYAWWQRINGTPLTT